MPIFNDDNKFIVTKKLIDGNKEIIIIDNFLYDIDDIKKKRQIIRSRIYTRQLSRRKKIVINK